jgi:predicted secreted protein
MLKFRALAIFLTLVMAAGFILAGSSGVMAAKTFSVNESSSGGYLLVSTGDTVEVVLNQQTGSTGFSWGLVRNSDPGVLQNTGHITHEPSIPIPGGVGTDTWTFSALKAGASTIHMEYSQPWSGGFKNARSFDLTVFVFDQLPTVPASSGWSIGLMVACIAAILAFAIMRRTSRI